MTMEHREGIKVNLICTRCKRAFLRPACTIRADQNGFFCSRECLRKPIEEKRAQKKVNTKKWIAANPERHLKQRRGWREKNRDKIKEYKKKEYLKHKEKIRARNKKWNEKNKERLKLKRKEFYENNWEEIREKTRFYRQNNPKYTKYMEKYRISKRITNRQSIMWSTTKRSAKEKGILFNLTHDWIKERLDAAVCEMSGLPFDMKGKRTPDSPSIDRIKPGGDYTIDNCRIILWSLNRALSNFGEEYVLKVFDAVLRKKAQV